MGLYLKQNETRSELQTKVAADLSERLNKRALDENGIQPPAVQPAILDDTRPTSPLAWLWLVLAVLALGGLVFVLVV